MNNHHLTLNSFILQPGTGFKDAAIDRWHREDDPMRQIPLADYAAHRNVFEIPTEGNKSGPNSYMDRITKKILNLP